MKRFADSSRSMKARPSLTRTELRSNSFLSVGSAIAINRADKYTPRLVGVREMRKLCGGSDLRELAENLNVTQSAHNNSARTLSSATLRSPTPAGLKRHSRKH